jgi:hypothetical protein
MITTVDDLERERTRTDPLADLAIAALTTRPRRGQNVLDVIRDGARARIPAHERFLDETGTVPAWASLKDMRVGREMAMRRAPLTFLVLLAGSLIESFAAARGAVVLVRTGRLETDTLARIYETASMVRDMFLPGALAPGRRGHQALLRVRLLHAFVRRHVRAGFDVATLGEPVNQADMLHTLLLFSHVLVRGIETLGARVSDDEKESFLHLWRYAGFMLGVDERILPRTREEEAHVYALIRAREYAPDDGSRRLAHAVLKALAGEPPFFLTERALHEIARRLTGDALADDMYLMRSRPMTRALDVSAHGVSRIERAFTLPLAGPLSVAIGHLFVESNRVRVLATSTPADYVMRVMPGARRRAAHGASQRRET